MCHIDPGSEWQKRDNESFNGVFRVRWLDRSSFYEVDRAPKKHSFFVASIRTYPIPIVTKRLNVLISMLDFIIDKSSHGYRLGRYESSLER